ncbi:MAG: hypothetical protein AAF517_02510 [Planctomycetota bacterium]
MISAGNISFVCSGNICRSPMAEVIARAFLEKLAPGAKISSAGTLGMVGVSASAHGVEAVNMIGIDLTAHKSQGVSPAYLHEQDAIVVMAEEHARTVTLMAPELEPKIWRLWEHTTEEDRLDEIEDPVGGDLDDFIVCRDVLIECIKNWIPVYMETRGV